MRFNGRAGGSKSGFLRRIRTHARDTEIRELRDLGIPVKGIAAAYKITPQGIYGILKAAPVTSAARHFWHFIAHSKVLKKEHADIWNEFARNWQNRDQPPRPHWLS